MEPLDYLKILQRHWKMAVALIATVLVAVLVLTPSQPSKTYEARHTIQRTTASSGGVNAADNPSAVARYAGAGAVPIAVAEELGHDGPPDQLTSQMQFVPDLELGMVDVVASASTEEEAVLLANSFANQTLGYIEGENAKIAAEKDEQVAEIQVEVDALNAQIEAAGGDTAAPVSLVSARGALLDSQNQLRTEARANASQWQTLQEAASAKQVAASSVGVSQAQALLLGAVVSVLLAFGVAIMLDRSDSRLHTKEQAERQFGLPVLAEVPLLSIRNRHRAAVYGYEHEPSVAEAYRGLRTALLLFRDRLPLEVETAELTRRNQHRQGGRVGAARQVILVTSPEAGDGKSSSAANLAMAYAESGQSVLLVQWDLWRPLPAKVFDADEAPGVSEFLDAGNASLMHYVHSTSVPGLHLVPAGKLGHQPGAQLDAELRLLEEARGLADVVIIDTAPLLAASVTRELVTMADVVVLVSRVGRTTSPAAERSAELLERLGAPTLGVVLVGVPSGVFKNDYYTKPKSSRTDRLRESVLGRNGSDGMREPSRVVDQPFGRHAAGRPADTATDDVPAPAEPSERLPSRGSQQ